MPIFTKNLALLTENEVKSKIIYINMAKCSKCGSELKEGQKFCMKCGTPATANSPVAVKRQPIEAAVCANCGNPLKPGQKFCMKCGTPVRVATQQQPNQQPNQ